MKTRLINNFNWLAFEKLFRLVGSLILSIWIARYLGPSNLGDLSYAIAYAGLFGSVAKLGMDQIITREIIRKPVYESKLLSTLTMMKLLAASISILLLIISLFYSLQSVEKNQLIFVVAVGIVFNIFDPYEVYFRTRLESKYIALARTIAFLIMFLFRVLLILYQFDVFYFALATTLELGLGGLLLAVIYRAKIRDFIDWHMDFRLATEILKDGWSLILITALVVIHTKIDQVMIGAMLSSTELGVYSVASRIYETWLFVPIIICQTVTPYIVKVREINNTLYNQRFVQLYSLMFWLNLIVALFVFLLGDYLIEISFGERFKEASIPLTILLMTGIFTSQSIARNIWLVSENNVYYRLITNIVSVPLNILLNFYLIPLMGIKGGALASLISIGFGTWVVPFLFRELRYSNYQLIQSVNPIYIVKALR